MMRFLHKNISFLLAVCVICSLLSQSRADCETIDNGNIRRIVDYWISNPSTNPINECGPISNWNTSGVTDMSRLFHNVVDFDEDLSGWDTSSVTTMKQMFSYTSNFSSDVSRWDTSSVTNMKEMFFNTYNFASDVSNWDTSSVTDMSEMFYFTSNFSSDVSRWDTSSVTDMVEMFYATLNFSSDVSMWDTSSVTDMYEMFSDTYKFAADVSRWDTSSVTNMTDMFSDKYNFAIPQVLCWQLDNLVSKLDFCLMENVYLDCSCNIRKEAVTCPKCFESEDPKTSSAPTTSMLMRGSQLVFAVIVYTLL